jgi:hypothetical protein
MPSAERSSRVQLLTTLRRCFRLMTKQKSLTHSDKVKVMLMRGHISQQIHLRRHVVLRSRAFSNTCYTFVVEKPLSALHVE